VSPADVVPLRALPDLFVELVNEEPAFPCCLGGGFAVPDGRFEGHTLVGVEELGDVLACVALYSVCGGTDVDEDNAEEIEGGIEVEDGVQSGSYSSQALPTRLVALDRYEGPPSGRDGGGLQGLVAGRAVDEDHVVVAGDGLEQACDGEFGAVGVAVPERSQAGGGLVECRSTGDDVEVGPDLAEGLDGAAEHEALGEGGGVAEVFGEVALGVEVDEEHAVAAAGEHAADVGGQGGLEHSPFAIDDGDDPVECSPVEFLGLHASSRNDVISGIHVNSVGPGIAVNAMFDGNSGFGCNAAIDCFANKAVNSVISAIPADTCNDVIVSNARDSVGTSARVS
jgi:hypothetical protein